MYQNKIEHVVTRIGDIIIFSGLLIFFGIAEFNQIAGVAIGWSLGVLIFNLIQFLDLDWFHGGRKHVPDDALRQLPGRDSGRRSVANEQENTEN